MGEQGPVSGALLGVTIMVTGNQGKSGDSHSPSFCLSTTEIC